MWKTLTFFIFLLRTSLKASISKRGAFLIESALMISNNLIFFMIWWIFFRQFKDVGGWHFDDMVFVMSIGTGAYGLMQICCGGVRHLDQMIINGEIDPFMTQPKNLLVHILGSKSFSKGWGHLMTSGILLMLGGSATLHSIPLVIVSIISGCIVFTSFHVIAHCLPFWISAGEGLSKKYCDALFLFALYPTNIYPGLLQIVMFTVIPAGVITYLPVEMIRDFTWQKFFVLLGSALVFLVLAFLVFFAGLRRYESGNKFGIR